MERNRSSMPLTAHQKMEDDFLFSFLFLLSFGFSAHLGRTIWYHIVGRQHFFCIA